MCVGGILKIPRQPTKREKMSRLSSVSAVRTRFDGVGRVQLEPIPHETARSSKEHDLVGSMTWVQGSSQICKNKDARYPTLNSPTTSCFP